MGRHAEVGQTARPAARVGPIQWAQSKTESENDNAKDSDNDDANDNDNEYANSNGDDGTMTTMLG